MINSFTIFKALCLSNFCRLKKKQVFKPPSLLNLFNCFFMSVDDSKLTHNAMSVYFKHLRFYPKTGEDGTTSLIGPVNIISFRKSYTVGACKSTRSYILLPPFKNIEIISSFYINIPSIDRRDL